MTAPLDELLRERLLPPLDGGKESRGTVLVLGGSPSCPGAALLAGRAALRCGSGRVQLVVHPAVAPSLGVALPEALVLAWEAGAAPPPEAVRGRVEHAAVVVVGPGYETEAEAAAAAACAGEHASGAVVLDARALAAARTSRAQQGPLVVAPNPKEAGQLVGRDLAGEEPSEDEVAVLADAAAAVAGGPAAVRGATSVVADGHGGRWSLTPDLPALGTPGSGDVFTGALAAFLARGTPPLAALGWAIAAHAGAGRVLADRSPTGFLAREVADALPRALDRLHGT